MHWNLILLAESNEMTQVRSRCARCGI